MAAALDMISVTHVSGVIWREGVGRRTFEVGVYRHAGVYGCGYADYVWVGGFELYKTEERLVLTIFEGTARDVN